MNRCPHSSQPDRDASKCSLCQNATPTVRADIWSIDDAIARVRGASPKKIKPEPAPMPEGFCSSVEAARVLGIKKINAIPGGVTTVKVGPHRYYRRSDLERVAAAREGAEP